MIETTDFSKSEQYTLSIRLSTDGFSFSIFNPLGEGRFSFHEHGVDDSLSLTANLKNPFRRINVLMAGKRFTFIPLEFFEDEQAETVFYHNHSRQDNELVQYNILHKNNIVVLFGMDKSACSLLREQYPDVRFYAQASPLIEYFAAKSQLPENVCAPAQRSSRDIRLRTRPAGIRQHLCLQGDKRPPLLHSLCMEAARHGAGTRRAPPHRRTVRQRATAVRTEKIYPAGIHHEPCRQSRPTSHQPMRVISGIYKRRRFDVPHTFKARPTTDFAKENLFNVLSNYMDFEEGVRALDLFAGTGSISIELVSRGCDQVISVEKDRDHYAFICKVMKELKTDKCLPVRGDVFRYIQGSRERFDFIFADPPYGLKELETLPDLIFDNNLLKEDGLFVLEHGKTNNFEEHPCFLERRIYGSVNFSFFGIQG